jgi:kynurenine--oxoglutarate transaminase/cysteine-S-conjugate beta-lyase/glutamine--phenylpyruvate transaminase
LTFVPYNDDVGSASGGEWILEQEKLKNAVSSKTRAIILNSPHNPTGKVFTLSEMKTIAKSVLVAGPQCVAISDEVYKYIIHSPPPKHELLKGSSCPGHIHFASLPGMWDRTITVSSAGKTFSATGWQVGWCIGPSHLISPIHQLLPYVQFCASTVIQEALARTLPRADEPYEGYSTYYEYLNTKYRRKRDLLGNALKDAGFAIPDYDRTPGGGFFIFARITPELKSVLPPERMEPHYTKIPAAPGGEARLDWALCQWMAEEKGVLCIPSSPFFSRDKALKGASDEFIRVAFCKTDETISRAADALSGLKSSVENQ